MRFKAIPRKVHNNFPISNFVKFKAYRQFAENCFLRRELLQTCYVYSSIDFQSQLVRRLVRPGCRYLGQRTFNFSLPIITLNVHHTHKSPHLISKACPLQSTLPARVCPHPAHKFVYYNVIRVLVQRQKPRSHPRCVNCRTTPCWRWCARPEVTGDCCSTSCSRSSTVARWRRSCCIPSGVCRIHPQQTIWTTQLLLLRGEYTRRCCSTWRTTTSCPR